MKHLGTSRYELLETCYPGSTPKPRSGPENIEYEAENVAIIAEYLNLTAEEYSALIVEKTEEEYKYWGYKSNSDLLSTDESTHTGLRFIKAQFLPRSGIQFADLVELLKTEYINPMANFAARNTIVILHHSEQDMRYRLIRSNGKGLDISDWQRIRQFIHLWHRIGWTIDEIDKIICGLAKPAKITPYILGQLVAVFKLLKITKLDRSMLLTFWSQISMQGGDSLYSRLFLTGGAARADPVLQLDEHGYFFSFATIPQHEPLVMATLGLTKAGLDAISRHLENKELSIRNLSFLYRHGLMAKFLGVTPTVLMEMFQMIGYAFNSPAACLMFVEFWKRMGDIGLTFAQLNYVVTGVDDPTNPLALSSEKKKEILKSLLDRSAAHPKTTDSGTYGPRSERDQIKTHLETDLVVTIVSKALGLSIPITDALLSNLKIKETTTAMDIAKSFMQLELENRSRQFPLDVSLSLNFKHRLTTC